MKGETAVCCEGATLGNCGGGVGGGEGEIARERGE